MPVSYHVSVSSWRWSRGKKSEKSQSFHAALYVSITRGDARLLRCYRVAFQLGTMIDTTDWLFLGADAIEDAKR